MMVDAWTLLNAAAVGASLISCIVSVRDDKYGWAFGNFFMCAINAAFVLWRLADSSVHG